MIEQIAESENEAAQLANALKSAGGIVGKKLQESTDRVQELYEAQIDKRDELQAALDARTYSDENIANALQYRQDLEEGLENRTFEDVRRTLEVFHVQVIVKDQQARVKCLIPTGDNLIELHTSKRKFANVDMGSCQGLTVNPIAAGLPFRPGTGESPPSDAMYLT